jgi:uncharacterized protein DUF4911
MGERNNTPGAPQRDAHERQLEVHGPDGPPHAMCTLVFELPPREIVHFKAIIESYDNLATLRTEDPRRHRLKLYFAPEMAGEVNALLDSLAGTFSIRRISPA